MCARVWKMARFVEPETLLAADQEEEDGCCAENHFVCADGKLFTCGEADRTSRDEFIFLPAISAIRFSPSFSQYLHLRSIDLRSFATAVK